MKKKIYTLEVTDKIYHIFSGKGVLMPLDDSTGLDPSFFNDEIPDIYHYFR